ncbi:glycosyltransferase family 2 protein [Patescibacteria group bacterium]|nr:glycosyltransferase family 2 protein [Patescibacteria group bacterium]
MSPNTNLSLLLLTHNESENIKNNLDWLGECPNLNEIIVVDDQSTDKTIEALKSLKLPKATKLNICEHPLNNDFSAQRQFGVGKAGNDWIIWLDPDEKPDQQLVKFLNTFHPADLRPYSFRRLDTFGGRILLHGETGQCRLIRLFNRHQGKFIGQVHEIWQDKSAPLITNNTLHHFSHPDLYSFLNKINFYSDLRAEELFRQHTPPSLFQIIFYPMGKFFQNYIFRLGFLDSTPGIIMALTMSLHSFLVRAKLWQLWQK